MKNSRVSVWSKLGWSFLGAFAILILAATWLCSKKHNGTSARLNEAKSAQANLQKAIATYEELKSELTSLREQNSNLTKNVKALNDVTQTLDQLVVPDPDQIITFSPNVSDELNCKYLGYVPKGIHVFDWSAFESDKKIDQIDRHPDYSAQFTLTGPTKFEITCLGSSKGELHDAVELTLNLPGQTNVERKTIKFKRPFTIGGCSTQHSRKEGLPAYPNELVEFSRTNPKFKRGIETGDARHVFHTKHEDTDQKGRLMFTAMLHSDSHYCLKTGVALENRYSVGRSFNMQVDGSVEQLLDLYTVDPELPSRMLLQEGLNEGLHQAPMNGAFLNEK